MRSTLLCIAIILFISNTSSQVANPTKAKPLRLKSLSHTEIGMNSARPNVVIKNKQLTMVAGGADIWGTKDEFLFSYFSITGDFDFYVQIMSLTDPHLYTKAGIMARTDLTSSSQHVYYHVFSNNKTRNKNNGGCEFQYRLAEKETMRAIYPVDAIDKSDFQVDYPNTWIRLKRTGDIVDSFFSNDCRNWKHYSRLPISLPDTLYLGFAVTAHHKSAYATAVFANPMLVDSGK